MRGRGLLKASLMGRGLIRLTLATDLLCSRFVARLFLSALVSHNALV
jgi:hypothetical protein